VFIEIGSHLAFSRIFVNPKFTSPFNGNVEIGVLILTSKVTHFSRKVVASHDNHAFSGTLIKELAKLDFLPVALVLF
jgi:hypothetical protein